MLFSSLLLRERCRVEVNRKPSNLAISNREDLGDITLKPAPAGASQLITGQGTRLGSFYDQLPDFQRFHHGEEAFGRLEIGGPSRHLLHRAAEAGELQVLRQKRIPTPL